MKLFEDNYILKLAKCGNLLFSFNIPKNLKIYFNLMLHQWMKTISVFFFNNNNVLKVAFEMFKYLALLLAKTSVYIKVCKIM